MVDATIDAIRNLSLQVLRDTLVAEAQFLLGVRDDVEKVKRISRTIGALLKKAERERSDSPTLDDFIDQLRDLGFEAAIVLEIYAVEVESKREGQSFMEKYVIRLVCCVCECCSTHEVVKQARDIVARLAEITGKIGSELGQRSPEQDLSRLTYAHTYEPHVVGMKEKIDDLLAMVKEGEAWQRVIKICGIGGLGKTTLARKVYNHGDVVGSYARAWVCVTEQFQAKAVLSTILKKLHVEAKVDGKEVSELVSEIYSILEKRKKCLIVVDDIWENNHWNIIKSAFPETCNVLLTTRFENIANHECHPYKLGYLTEDEGWNLLLKVALPRDFASVGTVGRDLRSLKYVGRKIVVKCGGLPLSISVIGGILQQKKEDRLEEWEKVSRKIDSYLRHGEGVEQDTRVKQVLDLSYDALPNYLKPCFLYFACFAEDEEIEIEILYLMWIGEGFISEKHKGRKESLRDVAERYLIELGIRCMVQVHKTEISSHQKYDCRLHGLMHDLCSLKAEDVNFFKRIEISNIPSSSIGDSISRLAITSSSSYHSRTQRIRGLEKVKDLRSLMLLREHRFYQGGRVHIGDSTINLEKSKRLMILVLDNCEFEGEKLPSKVAKLIHLRYLSLYNSTLRQLPEYVCSMPYLHTLDLRVPYSKLTLRLPTAIRHMKRLRHLFLSVNIQVIGSGRDDEKLRLDGMVELETLERISSWGTCIADILKLSSLRRLKVTVADMDSLLAVIHHMSRNKNRSSQTYLAISNGFYSSSWEIGRDVFKDVLMSPSLVILSVLGCSISGGFPLYKGGMCRNLVTVQLCSCKVGEEDVNVLLEFGNYPMLQLLHLDTVEFGKTEKVINFRANSFPQLKSLNLLGLPDLEKWEVEVGAMPKLTELEIGKCRNLEKLPEGLRNISTIRKLEIFEMPEAFNERVREQDRGSISHIPFVKLDHYVLQFS